MGLGYPGQHQQPEFSTSRRTLALNKGSSAGLEFYILTDVHIKMCERIKTCYLKTEFLKLCSKYNSLVWNSD